MLIIPAAVYSATQMIRACLHDLGFFNSASDIRIEDVKTPHDNSDEYVISASMDGLYDLSLKMMCRIKWDGGWNDGLCRVTVPNGDAYTYLCNTGDGSWTPTRTFPEDAPSRFA